MKHYALLWLSGMGIAFSGSLFGESAKESKPSQNLKPQAQVAVDRVVEITAQAKASLVTITQHGRGGVQEGLGSGFVISEEGWIATNQHVIGKSRQLRVRLHDGSQHDVTRIVATDPRYDLAILQIKKSGLKPLPLGDDSVLQQGQKIVVLGNPHGVGPSVVEGVLSAHREIDGVSMLQIAMPIEEGNSGGPVLDLNGKVQGIVTLKSAITENLGFAHSVSDLKKLIEKPNPIPMKHWLTIGRLDASEWHTEDTSLWIQHAGMIQAITPSKIAGGRSLLMHRKAVNDAVEFSVRVKLEDESGAAGLAFFHDGEDRHYGFYPSAGELRLVRFDGPDVYNWNILAQGPSKAYRPKDWNHLKVQVRGSKLQCYVNGSLVFERDDATYRTGPAGLCKFRKTEASFKRFSASKGYESDELPAEWVKRLSPEIDAYLNEPSSPEPLIETLRQAPPSVETWMDRKHQALKEQLASLEKIRVKVHEAKVISSLTQRLQSTPTSKHPLLAACLHLAWYDNPEVDWEHYVDRANRITTEIASSFPKDATPRQKTDRLIQYLFHEQGFHGSRSEDLDQFSNSYLNEVLEDREGIPVSLAVLFLDLADRLQLDHVHGVSLPGRFMVAAKYPEDEKSPVVYYDLFEQGKAYSERKLESFIFQLTGQALSEASLAPCSTQDIVLRMLRNFVSFSQSTEQMLRYLDLIVAIRPESMEERMQRALILLKLGQRSQAKLDLQAVLDAAPEHLDLDRLRQLYRTL